MVNKLGENESLELFSYHAFGTTIPPEDFRNLSKSFTEYVDGLPLALKVLGSSLKVRDVSLWEEKLKKVKKIPENKIHEVLKLSYDELSDRTVKDIFLDIVSFFVGREKEEPVWIFESSGLFPHNGIQTLLERCLLTVDQNNRLQMHSLIQNMGWEVIHQESQEPGKKKRLIFQENVFELFKYQERTDKIEGLILDLTSWTPKDQSTNIFEMMPKLRLLEIVNAPHDLKMSFENSFRELRYIRWHYCPWTRLPFGFCPEKLILLDMQFSNFKTLWKGSLPLVNLKSINVSCSKDLKTIPDFNKLVKLEKLSLRYCGNLLKLPRSFLGLSKLNHLDLGECQNLKQLPPTIGQLDGLRKLALDGCFILKGLPDSIKHLTGLTELCLRECNYVTQLPELLGNLKGLEVLEACHTNIEQLPDSVCELSHLYYINLYSCKKLRYLPEQIGNMKGLMTFDLGETAIRQLPDSFEDLINLSVLNLGFCRNLERLPDQLGKMQCLKMLDTSSTAIEELPDSIAQLNRLERLELSGCQKLGEIPGGIWNLTSLTCLELLNRESLESLPDSIKDMEGLETLSVRCNIRSCLPTILCLTSLTYLVLRDDGESFSSTKPFSLSNLSNLEILRLEDCRSLGSFLPELPLNLEWLEIQRYESLERLPDLSTFNRLTRLWIIECNSLQSLPLLPPHLSFLKIHDCRSLRETNDHLTTLKDLIQLDFIECGNLIFNAEESFFQVLRSPGFHARIPAREIPNWIGNIRSGSKVDCVVPQMPSPNHSLFLLFWVIYNCPTDQEFEVKAVITTKSFVNYSSLREVRSVIPYIYPEPTSSCGVGSLIAGMYPQKNRYSPGDKLTVSFKVIDSLNKQNLEVSYRHVKVEKCGMHLMYKNTFEEWRLEGTLEYRRSVDQI